LDKILAKKMKKDVEGISHLLNFESGLYGLAGTKDIKYIFDKAEIEFLKKTGEFENEKIAFLIYFEKLIEKIFAFIGKMNGVDKIIFSGGTGYGNSFLRKRVAERLKIFNIAEKDFFITKIDEEKVIFNKVVDL
jgi:acetate kinase